MALPFILDNFADANLVDTIDRDGVLISTAEDQYTVLEAFIEDDEYLKDLRGQ